MPSKDHTSIQNIYDSIRRSQPQVEEVAPTEIVEEKKGSTLDYLVSKKKSISEVHQEAREVKAPSFNNSTTRYLK
jgi:hypothetical protein